MRWLIQYVRSCFCSHDWELIFDTMVEVDGGREVYSCKTYRCRKCGYSKRYKSH